MIKWGRKKVSVIGQAEGVNEETIRRALLIHSKSYKDRETQKVLNSLTKVQVEKWQNAFVARCFAKDGKSILVYVRSA